MQDQKLVQLIKRCKKQDQKAQIEVYDLFFKAMFNTAYRIVQNKMLAEDIMQEAFITAFTKLENLQKEITFSKWLKQIVVHKSISQLKHEKRFSSLDVTKTKDDSYEDNNISFTEYKDELQRVISTINSLKDNYRILLTLHYIEGFDYEEIVDITGFTPTNCRTIMSRAKVSLRKKLGLCSTITA